MKGGSVLFVVTSTLTTHLTPNTYLSTPRLRYCIPKINTHQLSSFAEPGYCLCYPIKSLAATKPHRVYWHILTTDWLPAPLRTRHGIVWEFVLSMFGLGGRCLYFVHIQMKRYISVACTFLHDDFVLEFFFDIGSQIWHLFVLFFQVPRHWCLPDWAKCLPKCQRVSV